VLCFSISVTEVAVWWELFGIAGCSRALGLYG
jgi:hypothetical protein